MSRRAAVAFLVALIALLVVAMARAGDAIVGVVLEHHRDGHRRVVGRGQIRFDGRGPEKWAAAYRREHRAAVNLAAVVRRQRRLLRRLQTQRTRTLQSATPAATTVPAVICAVFGPYCSQAVAVARCESGLSIYARNGQYENIFQMGYNERRTYGWHTAGSSPWLAARAAYRYFIASGADWSPWQCKP